VRHNPVHNPYNLWRSDDCGESIHVVHAKIAEGATCEVRWLQPAAFVRSTNSLRLVAISLKDDLFALRTTGPQRRHGHGDWKSIV